MEFDEELAELQDALATIDYYEAVAAMQSAKDKGINYLLLKILQPIKIRMDGNKNHKRPHVHIDYGKQYHVASYAIDTGERIVGNLHRSYDSQVYGWIGKHRSKLFEAWELMQAGKNAAPLACELRAK